jgi:hypothetical protein
LTLALFLSFSASVSSFCSLRLSGILKVPSSLSAAFGTTNLRGPVSVYLYSDISQSQYNVYIVQYSVFVCTISKVNQCYEHVKTFVMADASSSTVTNVPISYD